MFALCRWKTVNIRFWPEMRGRSWNLIWLCSSKFRPHLIEVFWAIVVLLVWLLSLLALLLPVFRGFSGHPAPSKPIHFVVQFFSYALEKRFGPLIMLSFPPIIKIGSPWKSRLLKFYNLSYQVLLKLKLTEILYFRKNTVFVFDEKIFEYWE